MHEDTIRANVEFYTRLFSQAGTDPAGTNLLDARAAWALSQIPRRLDAGDIPAALLWLGFVHGIALVTGRATMEDIRDQRRPEGSVAIPTHRPANPERLKVYIAPNVGGQLTAIVAAKSIKEACTLISVSEHGFRQMGGHATNHPAYVHFALTYPRQPLWREIHPHPGEEDAWSLDRSLVLDRSRRRQTRKP